MSLNKSTMTGMMSMIKNMLPYEYGYNPVQEGTRCLNDVVQALGGLIGPLAEYEGFVGHLLKQLDSKPPEYLEARLIAIRDVLVGYYPIDEPCNVTYEEEKYYDEVNE